MFPKLDVSEEFEDYWHKNKENWICFFKEEAMSHSGTNSKDFLVFLNKKNSCEKLKTFVELLFSIIKTKKIGSKNKEKIKIIILENAELIFLFKLILRKDFFQENIDLFGIDEKWLITKKWKKEYKKNLKEIFR